ncbi:MAG TPA: AmmeMemoRadiSam system protein A [Thermoanaerobaculia bacterium]|nr:AmmeMemoRadiSam system protein A [Thermoanaerobaculia bacterium]
MLDPQQRQTLLSIARRSIEAVLDGRRPELDPSQLDEVLRRPSGAFVTLHTNRGDLRGCIGSIEAVAPLSNAVASNAINAAFRDPRFHPVQREELASLQIEISVMSPIECVSSIEEIEVGRDGLIISRGSRAGLLLPQVATEYGWDRETFLAQTCVKAGLPPDSWRSPDIRIERFSAEVFGE